MMIAFVGPKLRDYDNNERETSEGTVQALGTIRRPLRTRVLPCLESAAVPRLDAPIAKGRKSAPRLLVATWKVI